MKKALVPDTKQIRKRMVDLDINSINDLALKSGVSKPTIYEYLNGKSPVSSSFLRLCECLKVSPNEILIESKVKGKDNRV